MCLTSYSFYSNLLKSTFIRSRTRYIFNTGDEQHTSYVQRDGSSMREESGYRISKGKRSVAMRARARWGKSQILFSMIGMNEEARGENTEAQNVEGRIESSRHNANFTMTLTVSSCVNFLFLLSHVTFLF